jgi:hypothetical protein
MGESELPHTWRLGPCPLIIALRPLAHWTPDRALHGD